MGQRKYFMRFNRQSGGILMLALILALYAAFHWSQTRTSDTVQPTVLAANQVQQQVIEGIGNLPGIDEVFVNQLKDGSYHVRTTAVLQDQPSFDMQTAKLTAVQYMREVYALPLPIASAEIYIQQNGRLIMGMGVGKDHKDLFEAMPVNAGDQQAEQVIAALQAVGNQNATQSAKMAWFEEVHSP
ncbi:hypothetical protein LSG31_16115 [Fodinisporobacter ferrooxydans]|uniref:Uncharacterized protein n=1 Tax=Fodinisporobacter ferrooxydans TaxID=2901836 RepID=A0ABY4CFW3_9BACL|nr:hypothetical protein LSG31_16115 [Alicyclobacillaceae bacterium MYW30-H2]